MNRIATINKKSTAKDGETLGPLCTTGGNKKWCSFYRKWYRSKVWWHVSIIPVRQEDQKFKDSLNNSASFLPQNKNF